MIPNRGFRLWALLLLGAAWVIGGAHIAAAQSDDDKISLQVTRVGVGNLAREGSWTALRVDVNDQGLVSQREIILRVRLTDPDGDEADYDRVVTSNAGLAQAFWLYAKLPLLSSGADWIEVLAYEALESSDPRFGYRAGTLLGRTQFSIQRVMPGPRAFIGVIGPNSFGLNEYGPTGSFESFLPLGHEITYLAGGLDVSDLPDRWHGLLSFDALVWGSTRDRTDPGLLSPDKARAIREWVERGGHLIIVLPSIGQEWFSETGNPLVDLLPDIKPPKTLEGVDLNQDRPLLTYAKSDEVPLPSGVMVRTFEPAEGAGPEAAIPILNDRAGHCVVIRRLVGAGAVTLIGLDLNLTSLRNLGLPNAEAFWHRVLGRRGQLATATEMQQLRASSTMNDPFQRAHVQLDVDIPEQIAMKGTAAFGVLLGFVVFISYWLVAGPLGFFVLGRYGLKRHAWVVFVASVAVFTGISWVGATVARPHRAIVRHVTLLEGVYGQPTQRARSWEALLVPYYGDAVVSVASDDEDVELGAGNVISPFEASGSMLSLVGFPDNRPYRVESRRPSEIWFPARSTVKEFEIEWSGRSRWKLPEPVKEPGELGDAVLRLVQEGEFDAEGKPIDSDAVGELVHSLPGPLEDVVVLVNKGQVTMFEGGRLRGQLGAAVTAYELTDSWKPDVRLSLREVTRRATEQGGASQVAAFRYLMQLLRGERAGPAQVSRPDPRRFGERLKALALFPELEPPTFQSTQGVESRLAKRDLTHGYDLGLFFTQPSIMIVGRVNLSGKEARSPVGLKLDGTEVPAEGTTLVMWVYPLPADPPEIQVSADLGAGG